MVADLVKAKLEQPYYLICYCGDAILTLEIAQQLAKINHQVKSIIFIDGTFKYHQPTTKDRYQTISKLGLDYISIKVKNKLKIINRNKNKPKEVKKNQQISLDNQFYQTYLSGRNEYSAEPYNGKIILLLSTEWQSADLSKIKKIAINHLEIHQIHGMHHYLFEEPYVEELTKTIKECLK